MIEIKKGDFIKTRSGEVHEVLKVEGSGYVQSTNGFSIQSRNEGRAKSIVYVWDGIFMNKRSIEEVEQMYQSKVSFYDALRGVILPEEINKEEAYKFVDYLESINFMKSR